MSAHSEAHYSPVNRASPPISFFPQKGIIQVSPTFHNQNQKFLEVRSDISRIIRRKSICSISYRPTAGLTPSVYRCSRNNSPSFGALCVKLYFHLDLTFSSIIENISCILRSFVLYSHVNLLDLCNEHQHD